MQWCNLDQLSLLLVFSLFTSLSLCLVSMMKLPAHKTLKSLLLGCNRVRQTDSKLIICFSEGHVQIINYLGANKFQKLLQQLIALRWGLWWVMSYSQFPPSLSIWTGTELMGKTPCYAGLGNAFEDREFSILKSGKCNFKNYTKSTISAMILGLA